MCGQWVWNSCVVLLVVEPTGSGVCSEVPRGRPRPGGVRTEGPGRRTNVSERIVSPPRSPSLASKEYPLRFTGGRRASVVLFNFLSLLSGFELRRGRSWRYPEKHKEQSGVFHLQRRTVKASFEHPVGSADSLSEEPFPSVVKHR